MGILHIRFGFRGAYRGYSDDTNRGRRMKIFGKEDLSASIRDQLLMHEIKTLVQEIENLKEFIQEIHRLIENLGYDRRSK